MKQLKVIAEFRDKHNFLLNHEVGETLYIDDEKRAARPLRWMRPQRRKKPLWKRRLQPKRKKPPL